MQSLLTLRCFDANIVMALCLYGQAADEPRFYTEEEMEEELNI